MAVQEERRASKAKSPLVMTRGIDQCWYVAIMCALTTFFTSATIRSSGFLYVGIMKEFNVDRGQAAWPICLMGAMGDMVGIVAGPLCQKYTAQPLMFSGGILMASGIIASSFAPTITWIAVTQGIVFGLGSGLVFMTLPVVVSQYFDKYRAFAAGIMYTGSTSSAFVFPRLLLFLEQTYNFRSSVMIFGALIAHIAAISLLLKEPPWIRRKRAEDSRTLKHAKMVFTIRKEASRELSQCTQKELTAGPQKKAPAKQQEKKPVNPWGFRHAFTVFTSPMFYVVMMTYIVFYYNFDVFMATVVDYAIDKGTALDAAVGLIPFFSMTDTFGRLCIPLLSDKGYVTRSCLAMMTYLWMAIVLQAFPLVTGYYQALAVCLCFAMGIGSGVTLCPTLMVDYMGIQRLPLSYGIAGAVAGPLFILKPFFIGYFRDYVGSYDNMYRFLSGALFLLALVWLAVFLSESSKKKAWKPSLVGAIGAIGATVDAHGAFYCNPGFTANEPGSSDGSIQDTQSAECSNAVKCVDSEQCAGARSCGKATCI